MNTDLMIALDDVLVIRRAFVRLTGSLEAAMMLNQLLHWTPLSQLEIEGVGGWLVRSDQDWTQELMLTNYAVRQARKRLEALGLIDVVVRKFEGNPKNHYRLKLDVLARIV